MNEMIVLYENKNGDKIRREYGKISDFLDEMKSDILDAPMLDCQNVYARFYENPELDRHFATIKELFLYCQAFVNGDRAHP